jgi:hypothetical protein
MATKTHPTSGIKEMRWIASSNAASMRSPFSSVEQVYDFGGQMRSVEITLAAMSMTLAKEWRGFFLSLNGPVGTFYLSDTPGIRDAVGTATGTPVVAAGNSALSESLLTSGWTNSITGILKAGDEFSIDDRLYTATADADSDGSGLSTISIWPRLGAIVPTTSTTLDFGSSARGIFRLDELPSWPNRLGNYQSEITFTAREALATLT